MCAQKPAVIGRMRPVRTKFCLMAVIILASVTAGGGPTKAADYSGYWDVSPCVGTNCLFFSGGSVSLSFCSIAISDQYPALTVALGDPPIFLTGSFLTSTSFHVEGSVNSDCDVMFSLDGQFTDSATFTAYFDKAVSGGGLCALTTCYPSQGVNIVGTRAASCCAGFSGNIDCDLGNGVDISDLTTLVDYLYISFTPLCCEASANTDGQPGVDISDLSALVDCLYINFTPTATCQ